MWDRLLQVFYPEICARYEQLRQELLTAERICGKVSDFLRPISDDFYEADRRLYPEMPQPVLSAQEQIEGYIYERLLLLDQIFLTAEA